VIVYVIESGDSTQLHTFPTRRSSDLCLSNEAIMPSTVTCTLSIRAARWGDAGVCNLYASSQQRTLLWGVSDRMVSVSVSSSSPRSEEHTSELQSRENLVCRLLIEQKT